MRKKDRDLEKEERREREEIIGRRPVKPDKNQIKKNREKAEKKIKRVKRSTTFFYWVLWGVMLGVLTTNYFIGFGELVISLIMLGFAILAWKNAYHRGFFKTLLLPVGYGLGIVALPIVRFFIDCNFVLDELVKLLVRINMLPLFYHWLLGAVPAFVGVILGSLFGIGYRRKLRG